MLLYLEPPLLAIWFDLVSLYTTDVIQYIQGISWKSRQKYASRQHD